MGALVALVPRQARRQSIRETTIRPLTDRRALRYKVTMDTNWAAEHLQVIRTLMERSSIYRRALAPIMTVAGVLGIVGAVIPCFWPHDSNREFAFLWLAVSVTAAVVSFLLVRRQALKAAEPFWSLPTRRVSQALIPHFLVGFLAGAVVLLCKNVPEGFAWILPPLWMICYGSGLHAAGTFMKRGIRISGWVFWLSGISWSIALLMVPSLRTAELGHYAMGIVFGVLHLLCGGYLYFTERKA